jgi:hypothetical protein
MYSENDRGEVVLILSRNDLDILLMALGSATAISKQDRGVPYEILIPMLNRLMEGNPHWVPYEVSRHE